MFSVRGNYCKIEAALDGCNTCSKGGLNEKRECYACDPGYNLNNGRCEKTKRTQCHQDGGVWSNAEKKNCIGDNEEWDVNSDRCVLKQEESSILCNGKPNHFWDKTEKKCYPYTNRVVVKVDGKIIELNADKIIDTKATLNVVHDSMLDLYGNLDSDDVGMYDRTLGKGDCSYDAKKWGWQWKWDQKESKCYIKMNKDWCERKSGSFENGTCTVK